MSNFEAKTTRHNAVTCRACGCRIDHATAILPGATKPQTGMYSSCFTCGEISIYIVGPLGVALREPTLDELAECHRRYGPIIQMITEFRAIRDIQ